MTVETARVGLVTAMLILGPLSAAGCLRDEKPFDMEVVHGGSAYALITHPGVDTMATVNLSVLPAQQGGCYGIPGDLRVSANGVPATSIRLDEESGTDAPASPCDSFQITHLVATLTVADTTQPTTVEIRQGNDRAAMAIPPIPRPTLTLVWYGMPEGIADGSATYADLVPQSGSPGDVASGFGCWNGRFCSAGDATSCASPGFVQISSQPSSAGAQLSFSFRNQAPGDRSLWIDGSAALGCHMPMASDCSGLAACGISSDNYRYLLGPYLFHVR